MQWLNVKEQKDKLWSTKFYSGKQKIKQQNILKTWDHVTQEGKQFLLLQAQGNVIDEIISFLCFILHADEI
jgi:hypothetical protein